MRDMYNVFHLAIPTHDLDAAYDFYVTGLGCKLARRYADRITLDFFGDQVVCHLSNKIDEHPQMYPRHFGITFRERYQFENLLRLARARELKFFQEPMRRFEGKIEEHETFFLIDPSNNLLEFKYYLDERMMY
ncbi:MAG: VOC family protein [Alicyclobacillus sp.]|nr:VOC family protein [Alicyclobacillus sp.]